MSIQIDSDGVTVWVNDDTCCLGRFGRFGIDVHHKFDPNADRNTECLHCTHTATTAEDWEIFKEKMLEHHGVTVTDKYKPDRFK